MTQNQGSERSNWVQIMVLFAGVIAVFAGVIIANNNANDDDDPYVFFDSIEDNETVPTTFTVNMGAEGLTVEPAGEINEGAGHFHILIDTDFIEAGEIIPNDEQHRHFGDGSTQTELTLEAGTHILRLQFANGAHQALEGSQYRDEITINVLEEADEE